MSTLLETLKIPFGMIFENFKRYHALNAFTIKGFDDEDPYTLLIDSRHEHLYGIELSSASSTVQFLSEENINDIFLTYREKEDAFVVGAVVKRGLFHKNYLFSYNKSVLIKIARYFDTELLENIELLNVVLDCFMANSYQVEERTLQRNIDFARSGEYDSIALNFNEYLKNIIYSNIENITCYQGTEYYATLEKDGEDISAKSNIPRFYGLDFEGVYWYRIDFSKYTVQNTIEIRKSNARAEGNSAYWDMLKEQYETGSKKLAIINSILMVKGEHDRENLPADAGNCFKCRFFEFSLWKEELIRYSLLKTKNIEFGDHPVDDRFLGKFIASSQKMDSDEADFYGTDEAGGFVNYAFKKTTRKHKNKSPHFLMIGVTGSGKTTNTNKIVSLLTGVNYKSMKATRLHQNYIRSFDIKKSQLKIAEFIAQNNENPIQFMNASLNDLRYNLINCDTRLKPGGGIWVDEEDIAFASLLASIILETQDRQNSNAGFSIMEKNLFEKAVRDLYLRRDYVGCFIRDIERTQPKLHARLIKLGYKNTDKAVDITHKELKHLTKPRVHDVIKRITLWSAEYKRMNQRDYYEAAESLKSKLESIRDMKGGIFADYDSINFDGGPYIYYDLDRIKDLPEFVPIYLAIFSRIYRRDKIRQEFLRSKHKGRPKIYYLFEEAYNFFVVPAFREYLDKFVNEARSYDIIIGFISQRLAHIPESVFEQIENKIFLFPGDSKKSKVIMGIEKLAHPGEDVKEVMNRTPEFGMCIWNEHGAFNMSFDLSKFEIDLFGSDAEGIAEEEEIKEIEELLGV